MRILSDPPVHLTYCLNVHPGESWSENFAAIRTDALRVRDAVAPDTPFGLGLRLGHTAARELTVPETLDAFRAFLTENGLYVFTVNAFPYGQFHRTRVKEDVYRPDWRSPDRRDYTVVVAKALEALLPDGVTGSISTVPVGYKADLRGAADATAAIKHIAEVAEYLSRMAADSGKCIVLALEPEPDCFIENTAETVALFNGPLRDVGVAHLRRHFGTGVADAEAAIARHIGICADTAHLAVAFEDPAESLRTLEAACVRVAKVHLSAAIEVDGADACDALAAFDEDVYLHQVKVRDDHGRVRSYPDLPAAIASGGGDGTWRVHFHVPLFFEAAGALRSTAPLLASAAPLLIGGLTEQLEIETYTFGVLPEALAVSDIADGIAREYAWVEQHLIRT